MPRQSVKSLTIEVHLKLTRGLRVVQYRIKAHSEHLEGKLWYAAIALGRKTPSEFRSRRQEWDALLFFSKRKIIRQSK